MRETAETATDDVSDDRLLPVLAARGSALDEAIGQLFGDLFSTAMSAYDLAGQAAGRAAADSASLTLERQRIGQSRHRLELSQRSLVRSGRRGHDESVRGSRYLSYMSSNGGAGPVSLELTAILARLTELADLTAEPAADDGAELVDRIAVLEKARAALAAAQHTAMVAFGRAQVEEQAELVAAGRLDPEKLGHGVAEQIALAAHVSTWQGSRRFTIARTLANDLPNIRGLLAAGRISERLAETIVAQTSHLDAAQRHAVDKQLADTGLEQMGFRQAEARVKKLSYETDRAGYTARGRTARKDRRVTLRPAPDTMTVLSGLLPVEQGVACLAALRQAADGLIATGDTGGRTRDQILADTLVERLTGQTRAGDVNVEVGIVLPLDALTDPDTPAELVGHGPLPGGIVRDLLRSTAGARWWRRLFTHPAHATLVGGDPERRRFDGFLAQLIDLRDGGRCRDPYCDAPIPYRRAPLNDHIRAFRAGGPDQPHQRARGLRPRELRPRDARLAGPHRPRRARREPPHRADHHPDRPHLHQPRRTMSACSRSARAGQHLEVVTVGAAVPVQAPAAGVGVELASPGVHRVRPVRQVALPEPGQHLVERVLGDEERQVHRPWDLLDVHEVEAHAVPKMHRVEVAGPAHFQPQHLGEVLRRGPLVTARHDGVVELDGHRRPPRSARPRRR